MIGPAGFGQAPNTGVGKGTQENTPAFHWGWVPVQPRRRWFIRRGAETNLSRGFRSKQDASNWIDSQRLEWRAGFLFRLRGDDVDMCIVDKKGNRADAVSSRVTLL